jgi:RND superfamily putative drug exporter
MLLGDVLTDDMEFTSNPEALQAQEVIDEQFSANSADTEFFVVQAGSRTWGSDFSSFIQGLKTDIEALGPSVLAGPVMTYADALAAQESLFTPDDRGALLTLEASNEPAALIARLEAALEKPAPEGFNVELLTPEQLADLSGTSSSGPAEPDAPDAFILITHPTATTNTLHFLDAVRQVELVVSRTARSELAAPPFTGFDAMQQANSLLSTDRRTTLVAVPIIDQSEEIVAELRSVAGSASNETYTVEVAGQAALFADIMKLAEDDMRKSETLGLVVALIVLVVVFGSIVAAILPILQGLFAIAVAMGLVALVGQLFQFNLFVQNMATMIGLAVGIDYSLFIVSRYREERKKGHEKLEAIALSGATASRAVLFSGLTVILALLGMLIIPVSVFRSLAGGAILVTFVAIGASMTLLPAILGLLGDRINWPRLAKRARVESKFDPKGGFWDRVTRTVMARPVTFLVLSVLLLGTLGGFYFQLHRGTTNNVSTLPEEFRSRQAFITLVQEFNAGGITDPAQIIVKGDITTPAVEGALRGLQRGIAGNETFSGKTVTVRAKDGSVMMVSAFFAGDPTTDAAFDGIRELRTSIVPEAFDGVDGVEVLVGGNTAFFVDFLSVVDGYQWIVLAFVLGLSFMLLTVVFRSIVVPIKAIIMNLLSVAAAYGAVTLVFQKGFGIGFFNSIGIPFKRVEAIEAWLPLFLFSVLFGLSMDYHVFLLSRIREEYDKTHDNTEAVAYGLRTTAGIITGAALIMVAVFAAFAAGRLSQFQQMGFGLAIAVFMDATIVRTLLVPASMRLLGDWNWYLPKWLEWLPKLRVEGAESLQTTEPEFPELETIREPAAHV